jgi:GT2 family glycosyltransferase
VRAQPAEREVEGGHSGASGRLRAGRMSTPAGPSAAAPARAPVPRGARPCASGKFLFVGGEKLHVRGATYGTFRPNRDDELYPSPSVVACDFATMAEHGFNAVRTYTIPPLWLLDVAAEHGLYVMAGIAWEQHVDFLERRKRARSIEDRVRAAVSAMAGHPALLGYAIGNEIPSQIVRWLGRRRVERHVARLYRAAKSEDPGGLVTYVNYPPTEYLQLGFLDFMCFNVYLERRAAFDSYLARLQNISGELPLVMAEIGLDSRTHGEQVQAEVLNWQIRTALASGCAGAFVFAWTDEWYVSYLSEVAAAAGGQQIDDWDFGLTRRNRRPKPALHAARAAFQSAPAAPSGRWPRISVVVCTYNGAKTLHACLEGLMKLRYPDFEVIVVNDGSTDSTLAIAEKYAVHVISTDNRGLAAARNAGLRAASGEIVAYLDDDAVPDQDWLMHIAAAFEGTDYAGVGGPNVPPAARSAIAGCFADAPGTPIHVLISDREAEHIPGCNMAFRKRALEQIGGFELEFRIAGDDVDLCWRLLAAGHRLGFTAAALVWHKPRNSIRTYWRQQREYGRAEAMLERRWPDRYRGVHAHWAGRVYARGPLGLGRSRVYYGTWGSELFQSLYSPGAGALRSLLGAPEWHLWIAALALMSIAGLAWTPLLLTAPVLAAALGLTLAAAARSAAHTRAVLRPPRRRIRAANWAMTTLLNLLQPLARTRGRLGGRSEQARSPTRRLAIPSPRTLTEWTESWQSGESRLGEIERRLRAADAVVARGGAFDRWDLQARHGLTGAVRIRMGVEEHGAGRQLVRLRLTPRYSRAVLGLILVLLALSSLALAEGSRLAALMLFAAAGVLGARALRSAGRTMGSVLEQIRMPSRRSARAKRAVRGQLEST